MVTIYHHYLRTASIAPTQLAMKAISARFTASWSLVTSFFGHLLASNATQIFICCIGGLCSFLPLFSNYTSDFENTILRKSLTSGYYFRDSSMASLSLAIPIVIDILLDLTTSVTKKTRGMGRNENKGPCCLNNIEKFMLLGGIISVPLTAFLPYDCPNLGLIFFCCKKYQTVIVTGVVMISLCRNNVKFWSVCNTVFFLIVMSASASCSIFLRGFVLDNPTPLNIKLEIACTFFQWAPIVFLVACNIRWLTHVTLKNYNRVNYVPDANGGNRQCDVDLYFTTVWVLTTTAGMVFLIAVSATYLSDDKYDVVALLVNNVIFLSFELSITVFLMRIVKSDVVQGLVRYIALVTTVIVISSHSSFPIF